MADESKPVRMVAPEGCASASWRGRQIVVDKDGGAVVPAEAVEEMQRHGFTLPKAKGK